MDAVIRKVSFYNNPFIGLFIRASDELALVPKNAPEKLLKQAQEAFGAVPVIRMFINQSPLLGIYAAMNSKGCVLPSFASSEDVSLLKKHGLNVFLLDEHQACGNNILANNKAAFANPRISQKAASGISDALGVEVFQQQPLSGVGTFGSANVVTNKGLLAFNDTPDAELKRMETVFGVKGLSGSVNFGSPYCGTGVASNCHGALLGENTSGHEAQRVYEALFG
ncbi:MAG: translation initiation factor IF-6 [Candidatus Micrarchaeia archaeon]